MSTIYRNHKLIRLGKLKDQKRDKQYEDNGLKPNYYRGPRIKKVKDASS